ncbi:MAG: 1-aminocyclopropane-1-carboxylate deaminase/D-cysteine desulfhydrase [Bacteroidia bacterium]|nr:1-aminocyclopropane-1-carboxylate deaminase/D-cysteine desulfhydrase [Bacteroidia bacterium]
MQSVNPNPPIVKLNIPELDVELFVYQLYLTHPQISGNKWFKLKYNLQEARHLAHDTILTFGGAYSNHIYSTAAACKEFGFKSIGIIRGERPAELNPTLTFAESCGMVLHFVSRKDYREKHTAIFIEQLKKQFGNFYLVPEGGSNILGVKGCTEIARGANEIDFNYLCCACGTGATLAGISLSLKPQQQAIGFSILKGGDFLLDEVKKFRMEYVKKHSALQPAENNFSINTDYHFGGYAKSTSQLLQFVNEFEKQHNIPLDLVYTGKMFFGLLELVKKKYFKKGSKVLAIHTGGLR